MFAYHLRQDLRHRLKRSTSQVINYFIAFGIDIPSFTNAIRGFRHYVADRRKYLKTASPKDLVDFPFAKAYPCLNDRLASSGSASGHYFHQDLLIARRIFAANPVSHIDVGSRLDGFVAHVAVFRHIHVLDIREQEAKVENISFQQADITQSVPESLLEQFDSVSCLHALEHFGLGRYGDLVSPMAYRAGLDNLAKLLSPGGALYLSVPMGPQRIEFNAHRVFSFNFLLALMPADFKLDCFSFVDDRGALHENVEPSEELANINFGCQYGCGIFEFRKSNSDSSG